MAFTTIRWSTSLLVLICVCKETNTLPTSQQVRLAVSVRNYFHSGCVFVFESADKIIRDSVYRSLAVEEKVPTVVLPWTEELAQVKCRRNRPLLVITEAYGNSTSRLQQMLKATRPSNYIWLMFLKQDLSLNDYFTGITIPFDCEFLVAQEQDGEVALSEVYRVGETLPLQIFRFGTWAPDGHPSWPKTGFYRRRNNLQNVILKTGTLNGEYVRITKEVNNKPVEIGGIFGDIWNILEDKLKFRSDYYTPEKHSYGAYLGNGSWNGLVGLLVRNEVQVTTGDFIWNVKRSAVVDFVTQMNRFRTSMFIRRPESSDQVWDNYSSPLDADLWIAVGVTMAILSASLWLAEKLGRKFTKGMMAEQYVMNFVQSLFCTFGAFCSTGHDETPVFIPTRIVYLNTYLTAAIMMVSYSASLISHIMTNVYGLPFQDFEGFLQDGRYKLSVRSYGAQYMYFKLSSNAMLKDVYLKHIAPHEASLPSSMFEGVENICKRPYYAAMCYDTIVFSNLKKLNCTVQRIPNAYIPIAVSLAVQKGSPYLGLYRLTIRDMHRSGLFGVIRRRHYPEEIDEIESDFTSVTLRQVVPILVVLAAGVLLSMLLLLFECMSLRKHSSSNLLRGRKASLQSERKG